MFYKTLEKTTNLNYIKQNFYSSKIKNKKSGKYFLSTLDDLLQHHGLSTVLLIMPRLFLTRSDIFLKMATFKTNCLKSLPFWRRLQSDVKLPVEATPYPDLSPTYSKNLDSRRIDKALSYKRFNAFFFQIQTCFLWSVLWIWNCHSPADGGQPTAPRRNYGQPSVAPVATNRFLLKMPRASFLFSFLF